MTSVWGAVRGVAVVGWVAAGAWFSASSIGSSSSCWRSVIRVGRAGRPASIRAVPGLRATYGGTGISSTGPASLG